MSAPTIKRAAASRIEADSAALVQLSAHGGSGIGPTIADTCQGRQGECGHGDRCAWRLPAYPCRCAWTWVMSPAVDRYMDGYSPYQRSMPRTSCFCSEIAPGGQALVQTWHVLQNSSLPKRSGAIATKGMSVVTPARRTPAPNFLLMMEPCFQSSSIPEAPPSLTSTQTRAHPG